MVDDTEKQQSNSKEWLKEYQYKPGESGNPNGRPKGESITAKLRKILEEVSPDGRTYADIIAKEIVNNILDQGGNLKHGFNTPLLRELLERVEGKIPDKHEIETGDISIVYKQVKKEP